jgi:hypothetical protein
MGSSVDFPRLHFVDVAKSFRLAHLWQQAALPESCQLGHEKVRRHDAASLIGEFSGYEVRKLGIISECVGTSIQLGDMFRVDTRAALDVLPSLPTIRPQAPDKATGTDGICLRSVCAPDDSRRDKGGPADTQDDRQTDDVSPCPSEDLRPTDTEGNRKRGRGPSRIRTGAGGFAIFRSIAARINSKRGCVATQNRLVPLLVP